MAFRDPSKRQQKKDKKVLPVDLNVQTTLTQIDENTKETNLHTKETKVQIDDLNASSELLVDEQVKTNKGIDDLNAAAELMLETEVSSTDSISKKFHDFAEMLKKQFKPSEVDSLESIPDNASKIQQVTVTDPVEIVSSDNIKNDESSKMVGLLENINKNLTSKPKQQKEEKSKHKPVLRSIKQYAYTASDKSMKSIASGINSLSVIIAGFRTKMIIVALLVAAAIASLLIAVQYIKQNFEKWMVSLSKTWDDFKKHLDNMPITKAVIDLYESIKQFKKYLNSGQWFRDLSAFMKDTWQHIKDSATKIMSSIMHSAGKIISSIPGMKDIGNDMIRESFIMKSEAGVQLTESEIKESAEIIREKYKGVKPTDDTKHLYDSSGNIKSINDIINSEKMMYNMNSFDRDFSRTTDNSVEREFIKRDMINAIENSNISTDEKEMLIDRVENKTNEVKASSLPIIIKDPESNVDMKTAESIAVKEQKQHDRERYASDPRMANYNMMSSKVNNHVHMHNDARTNMSRPGMGNLK